VQGTTGDGGPARQATLGRPTGIAVDAAGNIYFTELTLDSQRVRRIDAVTGSISAFAGGGSPASGVGDGGLATLASFGSPTDVAIDSTGNVYIADQDHHRIRRVDATTKIITTVAGNGSGGFSGDGGPATAAQLQYPRGIAFDSAGNLYITDTYNDRVRRVAAGTGTITTIAGGGTGADGGLASAARLTYPIGIRLDAANNIYFVDYPTSPLSPAGQPHPGRVRRIDATTGIITTVAGGGATLALPDFFGDGGPATQATISDPVGLAIATNGDLYVTEAWFRHVRRVRAGTIDTVIGVVDALGMGPFAVARLADPRAVVVASPFTLIAGGASGTVQAIWTGGTQVETIAGHYAPQRRSFGNLARYRGSVPEGGDTVAPDTISGVAYDEATGRIYISETRSNRISTITRVVPTDPKTWTIATLTASGAVTEPMGLYLDASAGMLYVADRGNHAIRRIDIQTGAVTTLAGLPGRSGFTGDGGPATSARLNSPRAVTKCGDAIYVADTGNHRVRRIAAGTITTITGDGSASSAGLAGTPASAFPIDTPLALDCDAFGNLYVTSHTSVRLLVADAAHAIDGSGAMDTIYGRPPRSTFPEVATSCLTGLDVADDRRIVLTDACTGMLVELRRN
jgi:sugar lactone lactonase YvrE